MVLCDDFLVIKKKHVLHKSLKEIESNLIVMEPHCHLEKITISRALFYTNIIFDTNRQVHLIIRGLRWVKYVVMTEAISNSALVDLWVIQYLLFNIVWAWVNLNFPSGLLTEMTQDPTNV